jgi:Tfp pilus assembly protein PilX
MISSPHTTKGYALYTTIVLTALLIIVAYATANISIRQLQVSVSSADSQVAFYAADSGLECAMYADIKSGVTSPFATSTAGSISCAGLTITTGSQSVPTNPSQSSVIGGGGVGNPTSIFYILTNPGCAIVRVTKNATTSTTIESRGYNTCLSGLRFERGITVTY